MLEVAGLTGSDTDDTLLDVACSLDGAACQVCTPWTSNFNPTLHLEPQLQPQIINPTPKTLYPRH